MDNWDEGSHYERFMGRWSSLVARQFVTGLDEPAGLRWLDVGCGSGALLAAIAASEAPSHLTGVEPSPAFADLAASRLAGSARIHVASGEDLPFNDHSFDVVVSGLVLNFIGDPTRAVREWARVGAPRALVGGYVWDYASGMEFLRIFWDVVVSLDPSARSLDEAVRFPICDPERLQALFEECGLSDVHTDAITIPTVFAEFDDYWSPFLLGQGPAPSYVASLDPPGREALEEELRRALPQSRDGRIALTARAWTVTGRNGPQGGPTA